MIVHVQRSSRDLHRGGLSCPTMIWRGKRALSQMLGLHWRALVTTTKAGMRWCPGCWSPRDEPCFGFRRATGSMGAMQVNCGDSEAVDASH